MKYSVTRIHLTSLALFLLIFAGRLAAQEPADRGYKVKLGDRPDGNITLVCTNGQTVKLADLKGKLVLLQFTASWCTVCREEMPHLEKEIWQAYRNKGLVMIGVDRDEPMDTVRKFVRTMGISYPLALDPGASIFCRFAQCDAGVTRNVLIDRNGRIAYLTRLYDKEEFEGLKRKIEELTQPGL